MAKEISLKTSGRMPEKKSINFAHLGEYRINPVLAAVGIIVIVLLAAAFCKFAVIDRLQEVADAEAYASKQEALLAATNEKIDSYGDLVTKYAHYTYSGMTEDELSLQERVEILEMLDRVVFSKASVSSITLTKNTVTLPIIDLTLQDINLLSAELEKEDIVSFCVVTSAATTDVVDEGSRVTGQVVIYLNDAETED